MDIENEKIHTSQKTLKALVAHDGWSLAREKFTEKILELQNAFSIEDSTPEKMVIDLQSRKIASSVLFDFLREIEGTASQADEASIKSKDYIVRD